MVMWFNVKEARDYLLNNGFVYTLRPISKRKGGIRKLGREVLMYGEFGKKGDIIVEYITQVNQKEDLKEFVEHSGFNSIDDWLKKAGDSSYLYKVSLIDKSELEIKVDYILMNHINDLNDWEGKFIRSIKNQIFSGNFTTEKQRRVVVRIFDKYIGD